MSVSAYAWIIDKDYLDAGKQGDRAGTTGPHDAPDDLLARLVGSEDDEESYDDEREWFEDDEPFGPVWVDQD